MKKIILFLLFFVSINFIFSKSLGNTENNRIGVLDKKVDSLIEIQKISEVTILKERIIQATETIENQSAIISSFGTLYTIITIVLALIGVALPILTYQFGIKPSQKALEDFERNSERKFNEFLTISRNAEIENAIKNLIDKDSSVQNTAINFLSLNYHALLSNNQLLKIIDIITNEKLDNTTISQLYHVISNQKNDVVKKYFEKQINLNNVSKDSLILYYAIKAFSYYEYNSYNKALKNYVTANSEKFLEVISYMGVITKSNVIKLLNDDAIIDQLDQEDVEKIKTSIEFYVTDWQENKSNYENTYLGKKLQN